MAEPVSADVLRALSHPLRLALLVALEEHGPQTAAELAAALGMGEGEVHQHLAPLHDAGLIIDGEPDARLRAVGDGWASIARQLRALEGQRPPGSWEAGWAPPPEDG